MKQALEILRKKSIYLFLLPIFFAAHTIVENFNTPIVKPAILFALKYIVIGSCLAAAFRIFVSKWSHACLLSFLLISFHLFFGSFHDFAKTSFNGAFFTRYIFIIPATALFIVAVLLFLKKTNKNLYQLNLFLNCLFLLFILIDSVNIAFAFTKKKPVHVTSLSKEFTACDSCPKPDIYLVVADGYAGNKTLTEIFNFDNGDFSRELSQRGFQVLSNTRSNYNATVYTMASLFSMDYISTLNEPFVNNADMFICRALIKENNFIEFLKLNGYENLNFSEFEFDNKKNLINTPYFISPTKYLASQTFIARFWKNTGFRFQTEDKIKENWLHQYYNNLSIVKATKEEASIKRDKPRFVYSHLLMPHPPYYLNASGELQLSNLRDMNFQDVKNKYIAYTQYCNKLLLELIDHIRLNAKTPPIIMLISDHGFTFFPELINTSHQFNNLNAVYMPGGNYTGFTDGITTVNQLRILLNSQFSQKLPILKDSTSFIPEK